MTAQEVSKIQRTFLQSHGFTTLQTSNEVEAVMSNLSGNTLLLISSFKNHIIHEGVVDSISKNEGSISNLLSVFVDEDKAAAIKIFEYLPSVPKTFLGVAFFKNTEYVEFVRLLSEDVQGVSVKVTSTIQQL